MYAALRRWPALLAALLLAWPGADAEARVEGDAHQLYQQFRVFGGALSTGNTLMQSSVADPRVNSFLLPQSSADVRDVPFDGEIVGAYLFWTGSLSGRVDREVDFTVADGTTFRGVQADRCATVNGLGGFFYCRADVTQQVASHPGARQYNGSYTVGQLQADIGRLVPDGQGGVTCEDPQTCQAKYAAWSMVLVYEARSANGLRDVFLYDGFRNYDEDARSPGIDQFQIQGFDFPADGEARLDYFALEGDLFLGVPPQDNDPLFACDTCFDFLEFNGVRLQDGVNPGGNLFNSTTALGVDLEGFRVSELIQVGAQRATIRVGSGDGIVDRRNPDPAGGGESFFLGYVLLNVDRNAPDFRRDGTILSVVPDEGAPLERVVITLQLSNEGTLDAQQVGVRLALPPGLTYLPGSLRVDGEDPVPGDEAVNPLAAGLELGRLPFRGDNDRTITLRATIDANARPGQRIVSQAFVSAANLDEPTPTNEAVLVVLGGLELGQVTKAVADTDGDGRFSPGELVRYEIQINNPNNRDVAGVTFRDTLPAALELLQAVAPGGDDRSVPAENRVDIRELIIPSAPNGRLTVTILARIKDTAGLVGAGIPAGQINGFPVDNQADVVAAGRTRRSDDPSTAAAGDATRFRLSAAVDITGPNTRKTVEDVNGGFVEPGDTLRFTVQIANTGTAPAEVFVTDPLPAGLQGCVLESPQPDLVCAGDRLQGLVSVPAGGRETIVFTSQVSPAAQNGQVIRNVARLRASADPDQQPEVASEALRVFASPSLAQTTKTVPGRGDGVALPGERLQYRIRVPNTGNRPATDVVVTDVLPFDFAEVVPSDGGVYDAEANRITWRLGDIPPGGEAEVGFEAVLPPMVPNGTRIANQALAAAAELGQPAPSDDPSTEQLDDPTTLVVRSQARLQVSKTVQPREARPGDPVEWRIAVLNDGTDEARGLTIEDVLAVDALEGVVADGGAFDAETGRAQWAREAPLGVGERFEVTLRGRLRGVLRDGLTVQNQATVRAEGLAPRPSDDPATPAQDDPTTLVVRSDARFTLTKAVEDLNGGQVQPGDRLRYTLVLQANGTSPLTDIVVEDPLPGQLVDVAPQGGGRLLNGQITWAVAGPVRPDDPAPLTLVFEATVDEGAVAGARISNQATARSAEAERQASDDPSTVAAGDPTVVEVVSEPDVSGGLKTVEPRLARPGEVVTWRIRAGNQGTAPAAGVVVRDVLPAEVELVDAGGAQVEGGALVWRLGDLAPRTTRELVFTTRVRRPLDPGTQVRNQAQVTGEGGLAAVTDDPAQPGDDEPTLLEIDARPELQVRKRVEDRNGGVVEPGDTLRYVIDVTNVGGTAATDVTVLDVVDGLLAFNAPSPPAAEGPDRLQWDVGRIPVDGTVQLSFLAQVGVAPNGTRVPNQAQVRFNGGQGLVLSDDPTTAEPDDPTTVRVVSAADLSEFQKTVEALDDPPFRPGGQVRYRLRVRNVGTDAAQGLVVSDPVPAELQVEDSGEAQVVGDRLVFARARLAVGEVAEFIWTARLRAPLDNGTQVSNRAEATADGVADPFLSDDPNTPEVDATVFDVVSAPALRLAKRVEAPEGLPLRPGDVFDYVIEVTNAGDAVARNFEVVDPIPAGLQEVTPEAPGVLAGGQVRWQIAQQAPGAAPRVLRVRARVPRDAADGSRFENQALAGEVRSDDPATPAADDATVVVVRDGADFTGSPKTVEGDFVPGGVVQWAIRVRNRGTAVARTVRVVDALPAGVVFDGAAPAPQGEAPLTWALGDLQPGEEVTLQIRGRVVDEAEDGQLISNQATITADNAPEALSDDPTVDGLADPTTFEVRARPELTVEKALAPSDAGRRPGSRVVYTVTVRNVGAGPARDVEVVDPLSPQLVLEEAEGASVEGQLLTWRLDELPAGRAQEFTIVARVRDDAPLGQPVLNQAAARVGAGDLTRSDEVEFVVQAPQYTLQKAVEPEGLGGFLPGTTVLYALTLTNTGADPLVASQLIDPVDLARLEAIEPLDGGLFDARRGTVEWGAPATPALARLAPGDAVTVRLRARIAPALQPGDEIANQATAQARGGAPVLSDDPSLPGDRDPTIIEVVGGANWDVQKDIAAPRRAEIVAGGEVTYRVTVTNRGRAGSADAILTDPLPPQVDYVAGSARMNGQPVADAAGGASPFRAGVPLLGRQGQPGVVEAGERVRLEYTVRVRPGLPVGTTVSNQAELRDGAGNAEPSDDPTTAQDDDPTRFTLGGAPDLSSVRKDYRIVDGGGRDRALIGDVIEWTVQVTNLGNGPASDVILSDVIPDGTRYVGGSLVVDGRGVTDRVDGDPGSQIMGAAQARAPELAAGEGLELRFRTVVEAGPQIENVARVVAEGQVAQLSDVVVVPVGEAPRRALRLEKQVVDPDGPPALAGQRLRYTITAINAGTVDLDQVVVVDDLPPGLVFVDAVELPPGARIDVAPPPAGAFGNGQVRVQGFGVAQQARVRIAFEAEIDRRLRADRQICNEAEATAGQLEPQRSGAACVEAVVRFGRVAGATFQDLDEDGAYNPEADVAFAGMRVAAYSAEDPDGAPVFEVVTSEDGQFALDDLLPGAYRLRVFSSAGTLLKTVDQVAVQATETREQDLVIDPTGRVYESGEGGLVDGAEVFIYRDTDTDDDPYDAESLEGRVLVPPEDLEAASQQGQRTAHGGLYRFAVRRPGRYLVEVVPPGPALISPSVLVPPTPGLAFTDDPEGRVVEADLPSTDPSSDRTYFTAFELSGLDDQFRNNHIPLDPLSALIDVEKRSTRRQVTLGEVVTWEIDVVNRSPDDLRFDPATRSGGVFLQDVLPKGLKYVAGSAVWVRVERGREVPLSADDPIGARLLRFGRVDREGGRAVLRAMDLNAGEHLKLRYQTVVGADAKPRREYTNRAVLLADGNVPISRTARATVRVLADPDFDQGLVLGRVWCDTDGDGRQQPGEPGLPGVQLYMDHGYSAVTDSQGQFHFKDIDPGTHAVKVDRDSLLPGAEFTTDELRTFSFTRGLPVKVGFGVTCPADAVSGAQLVLAEGGLTAALAGLRAKATVVHGDVGALSAQSDGSAGVAPQVTLELLADGKPADGRDLRLRAGGSRDRLVFRPKVAADFPVARWTVRLGPLGEVGVPVLTGAGRPPAEVGWDQRSLDGLGVLTPGKVYAYRLEVADAQGLMASSAPGRFGLGVGRPALGKLVLRLQADQMKRGQLRGKAKAALRDVLAELKASALPVVVESHTDNQAGPLTARRRTRAQANAVRDLLAEAGIPVERIRADGLGGARPLVPNIVPRNQARNRRIEVWLRDPKATEGGEVPKLEPAPVVRVGRDEATPDADGRFAVTADVPPDGIVEVFMEAPDGRRAVIPLRLREGSPAARGAPRTLEVAGRVPGALTLGGAAVALPALDASVQGPAAVSLGTDGRPTAPVVFQLAAGGEIARWRLAIQAPGDRVVTVGEGTGSPPSRLSWAPAKGKRLFGGLYQARLTVRRADHAVVQSPPARFAVGVVTGATAAKPDGAWAVSVDGLTLKPAPDGRVAGRVQVRGGEAVLVDVASPQGGRALFFVPPPSPAAPGAPATVRPPKADAATTPLPALAGGDGPGALSRARYTKLGDPPGTVGSGRKALPASERARMADFGRSELVKILAPALGADADVPARTLKVMLPPAGTELPGASLPLQGETAPGNRVLVNGAEVFVDADGRFSAAAKVNPADGVVKVEAVDRQGNRAAIERSFPVRPYRWFLLALGESTLGAQGAELDGVEPHTHLTLGDRVYLHGRAAAFFKGYMKGSEVLGGTFERLEAVAHLDTARRREFETYFRQIVDPEAFYPVYGDSAQETKEVNTRGPLYVALRADKNELTVGNFRTRLRGVELFNYDRTLYGAAAQIDQPTGDFKHEVRAFVSDVDMPERHAYVELRGTGGSLYYLPHRELIEGSERLYLVERDRISNIERRKTLLTRNQDYVIQYRDGRVLMKAPVPSVTLDGFGALPQPSSGTVLDGHPVFVAVEYDHQDIGRFGDTAVGVHARETYKDAVSIGAGYVEEGRGSAGQPDYELWGVDLRAKYRRKTRFEAEFARSQSQNAENLFSLDGGLTFEPFNLRDGSRARGSSFLLRGGLELDDLAGEGDQDQWYTEAYWQYLAPGFYSGGNLQQQGLESYGVLSQYHLDEHNVFRIQHDGTVADEQATQGGPVFRAFRRDVTRVGHLYKAGKLQLDSEFVHTVVENGQASPLAIDPAQGPLNQQFDGGDLTTDVLNMGLRYALDDRWTLLAEQEVVVRGDARIHDQTTDLFATTVGARFKASEALTLELTESARWSGDNATQLGVRTQIDDRHTLYGQQRLINRDGAVNSTTVLGGEERFGADGGGRAFAEYQLESGALGERNRAVLGVGQRKELIDGLTLDAGYQRSQVLSGGGTGEFSQDALTLGLEWLDSDKVKISGRYEIRYEDYDETIGRRDRLQWLAMNSAAFKLHRDLTLLLRGNWSHTVDLAYNATEAELLEGSVGLAWRPVDHDWLAVILKYTKRYEQRPTDVTLQLPEREEADVVSLMPIVELPFGFQLVEKLAWKRNAIAAGAVPAVVGNTVLWINRLNYHLTNTWDVGAEYRFLRSSLAQNQMHGTLLEVNYIIQKTVRLGLGYNFTRFSDDEFSRLDEDHSGPFFRVVAHY